MENTERPTEARKPREDVLQFRESFETFNKIINNLQRQYLSLEKEYRDQGRELEEINRQLRQTVADNRAAALFLNSILTALTSGVVAVDKCGVISHFNHAAQRITGIPIARALGNDYSDVISAGSGARFSALETVNFEVEFDSEEKTILDSAGNEISVSVSTSLLRDETDRCIGAVEIFFDLTKIKKLETEVRRVQTLAALGEMAATVAHEVRNPLGGIGGFAALLKRKVEGDSDMAVLVDKIITGVSNLDRTVTALLDYTRKAHLNLREISLTRLIEDSVEYESVDENGSQDNIELDVQIENRNLKLNCDPHLMQQALLNLLRNSREAMPHGGRITIRAGLIAQNTGHVTAPAIGIEVEDTGQGISREVQDKIFRPFFTTKSKCSGSGLGLATVWKTINAHKGKITVSSEEGKGSVFKILLPVEESFLKGRDET